MNNDKDINKTIDPADLPQSEVFTEKEVFQHPQAADWGKPLDSTESQKDSGTAAVKEDDKASKVEGLNEAASQGDAGAFEGFEDQGKD